MPLFFIIAIGLGAATLGAGTVSVIDKHEDREAAQTRTASFQASAYATYDDCVRAAVQQHLETSVCQRS
jgi:hypothetical protein